MDRYAENEKKIAELHENLVNDIRETLKEKGYKSGDTVRGSDTFNIMSDRLLINGYHTALKTNELKYGLVLDSIDLPRLSLNGVGYHCCSQTP